MRYALIAFVLLLASGCGSHPQFVQERPPAPEVAVFGATESRAAAIQARVAHAWDAFGFHFDGWPARRVAEVVVFADRDTLPLPLHRTRQGRREWGMHERTFWGEAPSGEPVAYVYTTCVGASPKSLFHAWIHAAIGSPHHTSSLFAKADALDRALEEAAEVEATK